MDSLPARAFTLAPVTYLPRRARTPRIAYLPVDADARIPVLAPSDLPELMVHEGQGRSHARPIHAGPDGRLTPVMTLRLAPGADPSMPVPMPAAEILAAVASAAGAARLATHWPAQSALQGTPLMARATPTDARARLPVLEDLPGGTILDDGRDLARDALRRFLADGVRISGERFLVPMGGPLLHLDRDRRTLRASLNPALVDAREAAFPVFYPFHDALDRIVKLQNAGYAKGPLYTLAPRLDHLDANPARPPFDLMTLARAPWDSAHAAKATAMAAPAFALHATGYALAGLPEPEAAPFRRKAEALRVTDAWTRLGHGGPETPDRILEAALDLVEGTLAVAEARMRWEARAWCQEARAHALSRLAPATPESDADALGTLAP